jgi:aromatic-L-amino-acid/L-tryptophan decarboxylase
MAPHSLDPADWPAFRAQAHRMLDDALDYIEHIRRRPVWQPIPDSVRNHFRASVPHGPSSLASVHEEFLNQILPYATGNSHPGFMGWIHGGGTATGVLAEMLAAALNANLGGRDHVPIEVERQIVSWMQTLFSFPEGSTGLFVTGTSIANFIGVLIARDAASGFEIRCTGIAASPRHLTAYASVAVHTSVARAMDFSGLGSEALRLIPHMHPAALQQAIAADRLAGFIPFLIIGTAGSVDTGAFDDLNALADLARQEHLWFHVDGACGALAILAPDLAPLLRGIERADSLAFDFHKWGQVPYDAGFILVRDGVLHRQAFAANAAYLRREQTGLAGGPSWPCDFGPDLSRGFRALKTWFTLMVHGVDALGAVISGTCVLARYLESRIDQVPELELLAPVTLNIVCFRYRAGGHSHRVNARIVRDLHAAGEVAPSTTVIDGQLAIRAAIVNHRTSQSEIDTLIDRVLSLGSSLLASQAGSHQTQTVPSDEWLPRVQREARLRQPGIELFERACLLAEIGRTAEARDAYLALLAQNPSHRLALNNLGSLLYETGYRTAARTAYAEAVAHHPKDPMSRVNLANALRDGGDPVHARGQYEAALLLQPDHPEAHQGLANILSDAGDHSGAARHWRLGFESRPIVTRPYRGQGPRPPRFCVSPSDPRARLPYRTALSTRGDHREPLGRS